MNVTDLMKVLAPLLIAIVASNGVLVKVIHWLLTKKISENGEPVHPHEGCDKEPRIEALETKVPAMSEQIAVIKKGQEGQGNQIKDIKTNTDTIVHAMIKRGFIES